MSDLVKRLRRKVSPPYMKSDLLAQEAADRIEALEAALTRAANRLERLVLECPFGTPIRFDAAEWADAARAALKD